MIIANSYLTRARGIIVKYIYSRYWTGTSMQLRLMRGRLMSFAFEKTTRISFSSQLQASSSVIRKNTTMAYFFTHISRKRVHVLDIFDKLILATLYSISRWLHESSGNASWSHIPLSFLKEVGSSFLLECNYDLKCLKVSIPINFYKDILHTWQTINQHTPESKEQILNEILWNNRFIKIEKFSVYYQSWHMAGVIRVKDIFCESNFLTFNDFCRNSAI